MSVDRCYLCGSGIHVKDPHTDYDEFQVLELYALGHSYRQIAKELNISLHYVQKAMKNNPDVVKIRPVWCNGVKPGQKLWKQRRKNNGQAKD